MIAATARSASRRTRGVAEQFLDEVDDAAELGRSARSSMASTPASLGPDTLRYRDRMLHRAATVSLRPWETRDLALLEHLLGDPEMTAHLGGPESPIKLRRLHQDYLALRPPMGRMFAIVAGDEQTTVGSVGYWLADRGGETFWELGCSVLPEFQGRGYGTRALVLAPEIAHSDAPQRAIHAYPAVENAPSNAMCRSAGFRLAGETVVEYRPGKRIRVNDWMLPAA